MNVRHALLGIVFLMCGASVRASICDATFFQNGGLIEITGKGIVQVSARMTFSQVKKNGKTKLPSASQGKRQLCALWYVDGRGRS